MATKTYKCTNYAECDTALSKQPVEIEDGEDAICPNCGKATLESQGTARGGTKKDASAGRKLIIAAAAVLLLAVLAWAFWPHSPNPDMANAMLSDFFPRLTK